MLNSYEPAKKYLLLAQQLKPNCPGLDKKLQELAIKEKNYRSLERDMIKKMFAVTSNHVDGDASSNVGGNGSFHQTRMNGSRKVTIDGGVTITEIDDNDVGAAGNDAVDTIENTSESSIDLNFMSRIKPDYIRIIDRELEKLATSSSKQVLFPSNLSVDEITYIAASVSRYNCKLEFLHKGTAKHPKVVKILS